MTTLLPPPAAPPDGTTSTPAKTKIVADYTLTERIGVGSFATVFKAHPTINPDAGFVAVKAISVSRLNQKLVEALSSEIEILQKLRHPNIVQLLSHHKTKQHVYLILEYCPGGDLHAYIRRVGPLRGPVVRHFMGELAQGLSFLWGKALVHRDLKPHNLLLTTRSDTASLKIADFGFARHLSEAAMADTLCGSPLYMAPEILKHERYDAKADLWSVGTILFEMFVGRPPFAGANPVELLANIEKTELRIPSAADANDEAVDLLRRLLKVKPTERISFADFFASPYFRDPVALPPQLGLGKPTGLLYSSSSSSSSSNSSIGSVAHPPPPPAVSTSPQEQWEIVESAPAPLPAPPKPFPVSSTKSLDPSGRALTFAIQVGERAVHLAQLAERIVDLFYSEHPAGNESLAAAALVVESMRLLSLACIAADDAIDAAQASTSPQRVVQMKRCRAVAVELRAWFTASRDKAEKLLAASNQDEVPGARRILFCVACLLGRRAAGHQLLQGEGDTQDEEDYALGLMILQILTVADEKTLQPDDRRVLNGFLVMFLKRIKALREVRREARR